MILNDNVEDFLVIHHKNNDFIINRQQFVSSANFNKSNDSQLSYNYFEKILEYKNEKIIVFDVDKYLTDHYNIENEESSKLYIIAAIDSFSAATRMRLNEMLFKQNQSFSSNHIAFSVISRSEIRKKNILDFKLLSYFYLNYYYRRGLLGCAFEGERMQYFIDIEKIIYHSLKTGSSSR